MADVDRLIGFMAIMQVPFMNDPDALAYIEEVKTVLKQVKAQEPRVMAYDEMMKAEICFLEVKGIEQIDPFIRFEVDDKSYWSSPYTNNEDNPFELLAEQEEYLINARCWTSRPTDEQREAVKWDEPLKEG